MNKRSEANHEDRAHAPLPPSASSRWLVCYASQGYIRRLIEEGTIEKRESGPAAQRGTRIHEIAESWLRASIKGKKYKPPAKAAKDEVAEAKAYVDFCIRRWEEALLLDPDATYWIEERSVVTEENWGSVDFAILAAGRLTAIDLKSGREGVDAKGNTQLVNYLFGIAKTLPTWPREFESVIWQPNARDGGPPERAHVYTAKEFGALCDRHMEGVEKATLWLKKKRGHEAELVPGDHCRYCDALGVCPKAREQQLSIATTNFKPVTIERVEPPAPETLEPDQIAEILKRAPAFVKWLEAVEVRALELVQKGYCVPGFKVVQKVTRRVWDSKHTPSSIAKGLGLKVDQITETKLLSPSKVEELLPKEKRKKLSQYVFKPIGAPIIVPESDRREALPSAKISFKPVSNEEEID